MIKYKGQVNYVKRISRSNVSNCKFLTALIFMKKSVFKKVFILLIPSIEDIGSSWKVLGERGDDK